MSKVMEHPLAANNAVINFRKYLRINSMQPTPDYDGCIKFITEQAKELDLPLQVHEFVKGKPIAVITWTGTEPNLPSILLNGHMDVVPVDESQWNYDPFGAVMDEDGNIYARGAQDMKSVNIQYMEAIRYLKSNGVKLRRTVHISFVPDEEICGADGMALFVKTEEFKSLNIGFSLDECGPTVIDEYACMNCERVTRALEITCKGVTGHGSFMESNTAAEKVQYIINKFLGYREEQRKKLKDPLFDQGSVSSVNLTRIEGGVQSNVIPSKITVGFDCRVHPDDRFTFETKIKEWCQEAGPDVTYNILSRYPFVPKTKIDASNPFWVAFKRVFDRRNAKIRVITSPGASDGRFLREVGIPVLGFSPMPNTPFLMHNHNEHLNAKVFLDGIELYKDLITEIANVM